MRSLTPEERARLGALEALQYRVESPSAFISRITPHEPPLRHQAPLLDAFERSRRGPVYVLLSEPPGHAKTTHIAKCLAWRLLYDPACLNAYVTYGDDLSLEGSRKIRDYAVAAGVQLAKGNTAAGGWKTPQGGGLVATGIGGPLTGKRIKGVLVIDDPYKNREEADSEAHRKKVWNWWTSAAFTRRFPGWSVIVVHTRWHEDDLIGKLKEKMDLPWEVINLPAVSDANGAPIDEKLARGGRALWPEAFPLSDLRTQRAQNEYDWWSMYQGMPRPIGGAVFGEPATYATPEFTWTGKRGVILCDPAASAKTKADFSAIGVFAMEGYGEDSRMYVVDMRRMQVSIPDLVRKLREMQAHYGLLVGVEAVGGFKAVPQSLRDQDPKLRVVDVTPKGDKFTRAQPVASAWNTSRVLVQLGASWSPEYLSEMKRFTGLGDAHDDQVDATAHAWNLLYREKPSRAGNRSVEAAEF
jgi:predicted phage terminase large subunit-like protein